MRKNKSLGTTVKEMEISKNGEIIVGINLFGSSCKISSIIFNEFSKEEISESEVLSNFEVSFDFIIVDFTVFQSLYNKRSPSPIGGRLNFITFHINSE